MMCAVVDQRACGSGQHQQLLADASHPVIVFHAPPPYLPRQVYFSNRSAAYLKLGDAKSKALKDAERCMELAPEWSKAFSRLGAAQHALGRYDAAVQTFKVRERREQEKRVRSRCLVSGLPPYLCEPSHTRWTDCVLATTVDTFFWYEARSPCVGTVRPTPSLGAKTRPPKRRNTAVATPRFLSLRSLSRTQAGLAIDSNNSGLDSSLTAAKEAAETDRRERWRKAGLERAAEEERLKKRDALKAKAKADAAEAAKAGATGGGGGEGAAAKDASGDPLSSFFSEIQGEESKPPPPPKKVERVLHDKYTNQELGTPKEQMDRLLQHNYKWKNLNAFETLQLGPDATVEDIKQR